MEDEMKLDTAPRNWSYEEFAQLPDDGNRYEIIAGELYVTPSPLAWHQVVVTRCHNRSTSARSWIACGGIRGWDRARTPVVDHVDAGRWARRNDRI